MRLSLCAYLFHLFHVNLCLIGFLFCVPQIQHNKQNVPLTVIIRHYVCSCTYLVFQINVKEGGGRVISSFYSPFTTLSYLLFSVAVHNHLLPDHVPNLFGGFCNLTCFDY